MIDIPPQISFVFFFVWMIFFLSGKYQYSKIKSFTLNFVEEKIREVYAHNPKITVNEFYKMIYPLWRDSITGKYWFIPHKTELFPIKASPENIAKRLNLSPEWLGAYLEIKGYRLKRSRQQEQRIQEIIALTPKR